MTVLPSLILQPAAPRYSRETCSLFLALGAFCPAKAQTTVATKEIEASADLNIGMIPFSLDSLEV
jgi:hypothetical protein